MHYSIHEGSAIEEVLSVHPWAETGLESNPTVTSMSYQGHPEQPSTTMLA